VSFQEVHDADALCRWFFERSPDPVWLFQLEEPLRIDLPEDAQIEHFFRHGFVADCNDAMARLAEYPSAKEVVGVPLAEIMPREYPASTERLHAFIRSGYQLINWESQCVMDRTTSRWFQDSILGILEGDYLKNGWVLSRDITEQKRTEALLRENEQRLQLAIRAGQLGLWDWDLETNNVLWSDLHYKLLGMQPGEVTPGYDVFMSMVHPEDRGRVEERLWEARREGTEYNQEFRIVRGNIERWVSSRAIASYDDLHHPVRMTGVLSDITVQKRYEMALERQKQRVERDSKAKDQFLAALSHELRTPLTPVLMSISALAESPELPVHVRDELELIRRNVQAEARLIDDLLDRTGIVRGKVQLRRQPLDLHIHLTQTCRSVSRGELFQKQIALELRLSATHHCVSADPQRLGQVFGNLLRNAIKFTPTQGHIQIRTSNVGNRVRVEVEDSGIGIKKEMLERIFEPFEQGGGEVTTSFGGLGLGLAISKSLIESHGGTISAASEGPGAGATFTVELETIADHECTGQQLPPPPPESNGGAGRLRILLLEDHEPTLEILARLLRRNGYDVGTAKRISEARHLVQTEPWDVLISDLGLPDGSGFDFLKSLRAANIDLPAIALSGYGMEHDVNASKEAGFGEHLTKPVEWIKLHAALNRVPRRHG
jgi:PAS domain S-box-containing protein